MRLVIRLQFNLNTDDENGEMYPFQLATKIFRLVHFRAPRFKNPETLQGFADRVLPRITRGLRGPLTLTIMPQRKPWQTLRGWLALDSAECRTGLPASKGRIRFSTL